VLWHPPIKRTLGPEAVELYATTGQTLDPWQCHAMHVMCAISDDGKWLIFQCGCIIPRQNGKGAILECRALAGLYLFGERLIMWSAHEYKTAMEGFRRTRALIDNTDDLRRQVKRMTMTNGEECIELLSGQRLRFVARSKGSGRGFTADCNLLDEAYALTNEQLAALLPTMSAVPNPQVVLASSPPLDGASGEPLYAAREAALAGNNAHLGWIDYGLDLDPENLDDIAAAANPANWAAANPAYPHRIGRTTIEREHQSMPIEAFMRERLGVWPKRASDSGFIDMRQWARLARPEGALTDPVSFGVDIAPGRDYASIVACAKAEDGGHLIDLVDYRPGTDWVVSRVAELRAKWNPIGIAVDQRSPMGALIFDLEATGMPRAPDEDQIRRAPHRYWLERGQLVLPATADVAAACGQFYDAVSQGTMRHLGQAPLDVAVQSAAVRPVGDAYGWARRAASRDISPLCAATLARWVWMTREHLAHQDPLSGIW
jgi:hypothetical protein